MTAPASVPTTEPAARQEWTAEQLAAIERRNGDLLLDAGAGSGKTSVLVERFVRAVLEDGVDVGAILTITFTEKAAAEMRDRIRARLRELGADEAARATEGAFISTIHGFCARTLRAQALAAGIDPAFEVLDEQQARQLAEAAFDDALEELAQSGPPGVDLIAAYGPGPLRGAIVDTHAELRSRGDLCPALAPLPPAPSLEAARDELRRAAATAARELGEISEPSVRVVEALGRLERCEELIGGPDPWPVDLGRVGLPGGNGAALCTEACLAYAEALARFRSACEHRRAVHAHGLLDRLLQGYGARYAQRKRERSALDFEDLELLTSELLRSDAELLERYRDRFEHVMVDELQDTNSVQLDLVERIARKNLFTVGDAQQSIYAFRHADVELFARRGDRLGRIGARATLQTNFRSRREILEVLDRAFESELGEHFRPLRAGRTGPPAGGERVELLIADKGAEWTPDGLAAPWRVAEARALATRVGELVAGGVAPRDVVVLTRATTDLRVYERALEERGIPTYVIGGRGYWSHPQIVDLVSYLKLLANPREEEALYNVLASPLVGISADTLVLLAAAARSAGRDPWWMLGSPDGELDELDPVDRDKLSRFATWLAGEREAARRCGIETLIDRALELTRYDLTVLAMPGGQRRLANVRKLMRLGREHEEAAGRDLRGFVEFVRGGSSDVGPGDPRESEAPVEGEALDAVRLMTIHRAKGLEFEIVCVADLGRGPRRRADLIRLSPDGRFGLRLAEPGTGRAEPALDYKALGDERLAAEGREERRLFYVAMTRARERLIVSGAAKLDPWPESGGAGPIMWVAPALVPDIASRVAEGSGVTDGGVRLTLVRPADLDDPGDHAGTPDREGPAMRSLVEPPPPAPPAAPAPPVSSLSYSSLGEYRRCGYRFYVERVLRLPAVAEGAAAPAGFEGVRAPAGVGEAVAPAEALAPAAARAAERGVLVHALLERLDFRRPLRPTPAMVDAARHRGGLAWSPGEAEIEEVAELVRRFADSELSARLARATAVAREQRFAFLLGGVLINGAFDVLAREPGGRSLVVDYKTDRLEGGDPAALVAEAYATQRLVYALAVLKGGDAEVEVAHVFLEAPREPVSATFTQAQAPALAAQLAELAGGVLRREFVVTDQPHRLLCHGCPAEGGLCSWPLAMTRRDSPDRLF